MINIWIILLVFTLTMCGCYVTKKEFFTNPPKLDDEEYIGKKYSSNDALKAVDVFMQSFKTPHSIINVPKMGYNEGVFRFSCFIYDIDKGYMKQYKVSVKTPLRSKGDYEILESKQIDEKDNGNISGVNSYKESSGYTKLEQEEEKEKIAYKGRFIDKII